MSLEEVGLQLDCIVSLSSSGLLSGQDKVEDVFTCSLVDSLFTPHVSLFTCTLGSVLCLFDALYHPHPTHNAVHRAFPIVLVTNNCHSGRAHVHPLLHSSEFSLTSDFYTMIILSVHRIEHICQKFIDSTLHGFV